MSARRRSLLRLQGSSVMRTQSECSPRWITAQSFRSSWILRRSSPQTAKSFNSRLDSPPITFIWPMSSGKFPNPCEPGSNLSSTKRQHTHEYSYCTRPSSTAVPSFPAVPLRSTSESATTPFYATFPIFLKRNPISTNSTILWRWLKKFKLGQGRLAKRRST